jgi:hypothetical protein
MRRMRKRRGIGSGAGNGSRCERASAALDAVGVSISNTCILQVVAVLYCLRAVTLQAERKDAAIRSLGVCRKDTLYSLRAN